MTTSPKTSKTSCLDGIRTVLKAWGSEARSVGMTGSRIAELVRKTGAWTAPSADPVGTVLRTLSQAVRDRTPMPDGCVLVRTGPAKFLLAKDSGYECAAGTPDVPTRIDFKVGHVRTALKGIRYTTEQAKTLHATILEAFLFAAKRLNIDLRAVPRIQIRLTSKTDATYFRPLPSGAGVRLNFSIKPLVGMMIDADKSWRACIESAEPDGSLAWLGLLGFICHETVHLEQYLTGAMECPAAGGMRWKGQFVIDAAEYNEAINKGVCDYDLYSRLPWEIDANLRGFKTEHALLKAKGWLTPAAAEQIDVWIARHEQLRAAVADKWPDLKAI